MSNAYKKIFSIIESYYFEDLQGWYRYDSKSFVVVKAQKFFRSIMQTTSPTMIIYR